MKKTNLIKTFMMSTIIMGVFACGVFARGWSTDGSDWFYYDDDSEIKVTETIKSSGDDKFYLDVNGNMVRDYLLEDYNDAIYYFDDTGKMVKNTWVAVDPTQVVNQMDNSPSIYLYYFGSNGKAYKAKTNGVARKSIDGKKYLFNENGQMLSGWINEQGERYNEFDTDEDAFVGYCYYAGDETDGVLREGWSEYTDGSVDDKYYLKTSLWFYFKPSDNKKVFSDSSSQLVKRKINGSTYAFDYNGVMLQGWDSDMIESLDSTDLYFSEKKSDTGRMHKKEWIFAVPSEIQEAEEHDQEVSRWFYANGSGDIIKSAMRKINNNYYVFNEQGIMKTGLCIIDANKKEFVDCIDIEKTDGLDFIISRRYVSTEENESTSDDITKCFDEDKHKLYYFVEDEHSDQFGRRKLGEVTVSFADADYTFDSTNLGEKEGYKFKRYYQAGIKLKADAGLGLGLVLLGYSSESIAAGVSSRLEYMDASHSYSNPDLNHGGALTDYIVNMDPAFCEENGAYPVFAVVDANGNRVNRSNVYKKDKSGHYWAIGANAMFQKCFEIPIRYRKNEKEWQFKSEQLDSKGKSKSMWIKFGDPDIYNRTCMLERDAKYGDYGSYEVPIDDLFATNFRIAD